ncbi:MAG: family 78 glycoside hydrolase catalytic domain, partial [Prolixibacteraceae bacterium]
MSKVFFSAIVFFLLVLSVSSCRIADSQAKLYDLKCEFRENPLGIDRQQPLFQWKMNDGRRGAGQIAYQLIVAGSSDKIEQLEPDIWNSGKVFSDESVHVKYDGPDLESGKTYFWRVRVWDHTGKVSRWSEPAYWEMGLLDESDWQAKWIARSPDDPGRSVYMRKDIDVNSSDIKKARVYVTGLGNYVFKINGEKVGNDLLTPGWTHYPKRLEYQVYDVTDYLQEGENTLGAVLGNMWWSGGLGWKGGQKYSEGPLKFLMQLEIEFKDNTKTVVASDETWKWINSPIWEDDIYDGEKYDANQEIPGWDKPGFDDSGWQTVETASYEGKLTSPFAPAMRHQMDLEPVEMNEPVPGEYVYDLGQNMVGWAKVRINAPKGDTVTFRFAELINADGTVAQENLRSAEATDIIVSNGEEIVWEPKFTYHGFRYVQVSGLKEKPGMDDLTGKVIYTNQPFIGTFECSNELINH